MTDGTIKIGQQPYQWFCKGRYRVCFSEVLGELEKKVEGATAKEDYELARIYDHIRFYLLEKGLDVIKNK